MPTRFGLALVVGAAATACSGADQPTIGADQLVPVTSSVATLDGASGPGAGPTDPTAPHEVNGGPTSSTGPTATSPTATTAVPTSMGTALDTASPDTFPLQVRAGQRQLFDAAGRPFLLLGDAAWSLIVQLERDEVEQYIANRRALGFNAVLVELIEHRFSSNPPFNRDGEAPFTTPGDFSTPNEAYFEHADWVIRQLAAAGFVVLLTPAYTGWIGGDDGWWEEMVVAGPDVLREYGRWLGERYGDDPNIIWVEGGDGDPTDPELVAAIAEGISETDPDALHTAHLAPDTPPRDFWAGREWLDIDNVYTYEPVYGAARAAWEGSSKPYIMMESAYENEHDADARRLRTQAYHALLTGATGHVFGNNPIWHFDGGGLFDAPESWQEALDGPGSTSMAALAEVMGDVEWWKLQPDIDGDFLVDGVGDGGDRAAAAVADDDSWAMVYVPTRRSVVVASTRIGPESVRVTWIDPTDGNAAYTGELGSDDRLALDTPGDNRAGDKDWILLVERP